MNIQHLPFYTIMWKISVFIFVSMLIDFFVRQKSDFFVSNSN